LIAAHNAEALVTRLGRGARPFVTGGELLWGAPDVSVGMVSG
jgi:hypothetical protein